ncbi:nuclear transport factor 2 family protein [Kitasatospora sp. NPDC089797]|uniref:nuclear transport factor 2 family protein n=1 Tax=Kitasatospora sp. NPDC089797 TaxID=3155298 RepID=UPI0034291118
MPRTHLEVFQGYVYAGAISANADALAECFTPDGVFEAPLVPEGADFPRRLVGREQIRTEMAAYYARRVGDGLAPNLEKSGFVLHDTADPDVFIAEIDTFFDPDETVSLVQIFRLRDGRIAHLRDYFTPGLVSSDTP